MTAARLCKARIDSFRQDGSLRDLSAPAPEEVDFHEVAAALSRLNRFNGLTGESVAQHSVMGAQALLNEGADAFVAALFLLHDAHEYVLGDKVRPRQGLERAMLEACCGRREGQAYADVQAAMKAGWDAAIYEAAGLPAPNAWRKAWAKAVSTMDERMLHAEVEALFGAVGRAWAARQTPLPAPKLTGAIRPWAPMKAEEAFIAMFDRLIGEDKRDAARALHAAHVALTSKEF